MGDSDPDVEQSNASAPSSDESTMVTGSDGASDDSPTSEKTSLSAAELIDEQATPMVRWAVAGFLLTFGLAIALGSQLSPPVQPGYEITEKAMVEAQGSLLVTLDTRDRHGWSGVDLVSGLPTAPNVSSDLLVKRYTFRAPRGAIDLGDVSLDTARVPKGSKWLQDIKVDGELENPAFARWYEYGRSSHLLTSKEKTYAVRLSDKEGVAFVRIVSYYCAPEGSGCMTLRYRLSLPPT